MATQLHRFETYSQTPNTQEEVSQRCFQSEHGLFHLIINKSTDFNFELTTPSGEIIRDNFHWLEDRKYLYELLDKNIYNWLQKSFEEKLGEVMVNTDGYTIMKVIDADQYVMTIDPKTKNCRLEYPAIVREFKIEDIYEACPELPLLYDGMLDQHFREELKELGVNMPAAPYLPMLRIRQKTD